MTVVLDASAALEIALNRKNAGRFVEALQDADVRLARIFLSRKRSTRCGRNTGLADATLPSARKPSISL